MSADIDTQPDDRAWRSVAARAFRWTPKRRAADPAGWREHVAYTAAFNRGIMLDEWHCECGEPYTLATYPADACKCGRPFPCRCASQGCGRICHPRMYKTPGPLIGMQQVTSTARWDISETCATCLYENGHKARALTYARTVPQAYAGIAPVGIDPRGRDELVAALGAWTASRCGADDGRCALYLWGAAGTGKTFATAYAVHQAMVEHEIVGSAHWTTQAELFGVHMARMRHETDEAKRRADAAEHDWRACIETPLLVIDDLFVREPSKAFGEAMADLIRERLDRRAPMLLTSNHAPDWGLWFPNDVKRIESRWLAYGRTVEIHGPDYRARSAA